jgi:SOS-response transcriptional repressor LexA
MMASTRPMISHPTTQSVLEYIEQHICEYGVAPTRREISRHCFIAVGTVMHHLDKLERLGYLQQLPHIARGIVLLQVIDKK